MKITKARLRELIQEELAAEGHRTDMSMPALSPEDFEGAGLGDLQSDEKFTGGSPEEQLLTLMKAREVLTAMSKEELTALSKSLDAPMLATLRHILANPMYAPAGGQGAEMELEEGLSAAVQQLMRQHPGSAAKIKDYAESGYSLGDIKRYLNLSYRG